MENLLIERSIAGRWHTLARLRGDIMINENRSVEMKIKEQIEHLRLHGFYATDSLKADPVADTIERLYAVYESAFDWIYDDWGDIKHTDKLAQGLEDAVKAVQEMEDA